MTCFFFIIVLEDLCLFIDRTTKDVPGNGDREGTTCSKGPGVGLFCLLYMGHML